jgi:hypothetical protein
MKSKNMQVSPGDAVVLRYKRKAFCLRCTLAMFAALVVIAVAVVAALTLVFAANGENLQRFCIEATGPRAGSGSAGVMTGIVSLFSSQREIQWDLQHTALNGAILSLHIRGPVAPGDTFAGLSLALCGTPSSLACDTSVPGVLSGTIVQLNPGGMPLKPFIQAIRKEPWKYYLQVNTGAFDGVGNNGELVGPLNSICGTP